MQTEINWKQVKKEMRRFRKNIKDNCNIHMDMSEISFLMKWLENIVGYDD
jgi:hypothetical protein